MDKIRQVFASTPKIPLMPFVSAERRGYPPPPSPFAPFSGQPISSNSHKIRKILSVFNFRHLFAGAPGPSPLGTGEGGKADGSRLIAETWQPCVPVLLPRATPRTRNTSTHLHFKLKNTYSPVFLYEVRKQAPIASVSTRRSWPHRRWRQSPREAAAAPSASLTRTDVRRTLKGWNSK